MTADKKNLVWIKTKTKNTHIPTIILHWPSTILTPPKTEKSLQYLLTIEVGGSFTFSENIAHRQHLIRSWNFFLVDDVSTSLFPKYYHFRCCIQYQKYVQSRKKSWIKREGDKKLSKRDIWGGFGNTIASDIANFVNVEKEGVGRGMVRQKLFLIFAILIFGFIYVRVRPLYKFL